MSDTGVGPLVRPFVAERYADRERLGQLVAPPYDVISPARRAELANQDVHNIVHLTLPAAGDPYRHAKELLQAWRAGGVLTCDTRPTVTILRQDFVAPSGAGGSRTGFIAAVRAEPYETGRVRAHERTRREPKADRLRLLEATETALEPIFLLARDGDGAVSHYLQEETRRAAHATATLDGVLHSAWVVPGSPVEGLLETLANGPLYVADGHHRYETAAAYAADHPEADWMPALIVPVSDPGVAVLPTHRMVRGGPVDRGRFYAAIMHDLEPAEGRTPHCTVVWPQGREARLVLKSASSGEALAIRLDRHVIRPLLEAAGPSASLHYTPDEAQARASVATEEAAAAVLLPPTRVVDVLAVADGGGFMPPKSTYFYPKVPAGLVLGPLTQASAPRGSV